MGLFKCPRKGTYITDIASERTVEACFKNKLSEAYYVDGEPELTHTDAHTIAHTLIARSEQRSLKAFAFLVDAGIRDSEYLETLRLSVYACSFESVKSFKLEAKGEKSGRPSYAQHLYPGQSSQLTVLCSTETVVRLTCLIRETLLH